MPDAIMQPAGVDEPALVRVWDPVVRIFHWTVVIACALNLFVLEDGDLAHEITRYVVAALLLLRIAWGFIGTRHARFSDFVPSPSRLMRYVAAWIAGREPRYIGHNPAAALMILALMSLLALVSVTGWMATLDDFWGVEWVEDLHEASADLILWLAAVHAAAAIYESVRHRENLVWAMITGRKRR